MKAVGIRELKNRLSQYIRDVRAGEVVLVTDRGEVVAELRPPGISPPPPDVPPGLLDLARKGLIRLATEPNRPELYPKFEEVMTLDDLLRLLDEERGER
jgi:hypothetical protein